MTAALQNVAPSHAAGVVRVKTAGPKRGCIGDLVGHWKLREYMRLGEWWAVCISCSHHQLVRIGDVYVAKCKCCGRSSSYQTPSVRPKYIQAKR